MAVFAVTMFVEAKNEIGALSEFEKIILDGNFNRDDLVIEKDLDEDELESDWDDEPEWNEE